MSDDKRKDMDDVADTEWMDADSEDTDAGTDGDESPDPDFVAEDEGLKILNGELCLDGNPVTRDEALAHIETATNKKVDWREYAKDPTKFPELPAPIADSLRPTFKMAPDQKAVVVNGKIENKKAAKTKLLAFMGKIDYTKASDPSNDDYRLGVPLDVIKFLRPPKKPKASAALAVPSSLPPLPSPCKEPMPKERPQSVTDDKDGVPEFSSEPPTAVEVSPRKTKKRPMEPSVVVEAPEPSSEPSVAVEAPEPKRSHTTIFDRLKAFETDASNHGFTFKWSLTNKPLPPIHE